MKNAILSLALILSLNTFAESARPAGVGVAGVSVGGIGISVPGSRYFGAINGARYPYANLNGYYNVSSTLIAKGQTGTGTISFRSFTSSQEAYVMSCSRAYDYAGTKTCMEVGNNQLKYLTIANPLTKVVVLSVVDSYTGANTVLGYLRSN